MPIVTAENPPSPIIRRKAVVRMDREPGDPARVVGIVHPGFQPLQNREGIELFDALIGRGQRVYHTGGFLGKGEVVWLLARLPSEIKINGSDIVEPYILFTNSHDGTVAVDFRLTMICVVCQNTLSLALRNHQQTTVFKRAHQGNYDILQAQAEAFFKFSMDAASELEKEFRALNDVPFYAAAFDDFVEELLPLPRLPARGKDMPSVRRQYETRVRNIREMRDSIRRVFVSGIQNGLLNIVPAEETLWGALNAVTAFVDHEQVFKGDRYAHILFGSGANLKGLAYSLAKKQLQTRSSWKS